VHFRIRRTTPLRKLMNSYCERQGIDMQSVRFMVDGTFVEDEDTPESVGFCFESRQGCVLHFSFCVCACVCVCVSFLPLLR
jgi:Ubiquitin-2 like Rad60 SUMO-like